MLVLPYLHPLVLARQLATLDQLSQGRLVVGVGVGSLPDENAALGVPYKGRGRYADEFLEVLDRVVARQDREDRGLLHAVSLISAQNHVADPVTSGITAGSSTGTTA